MALTKIKSHSVAVNSLTVANIADNAIDATKIASNSILTRHIDDAQITTDQILDGTIATADIADDAVTEDKLANAINTSIAAKLPLAGGTLTGALTTNGVVNTGTSHNFALNTPNSLRINIDSNNSATDQIFVIGHNQTSVDNNNALMTILESGNVGIGTSSPTVNLDVNSTGQNVFTLDTTNSDGPLQIFRNNGTVRAYIGNAEGILGQGTTNFGIRAEAALYFGTNGNNTRMVITSGGNVGIGLPSGSPDARLTVSGAANSEQVIITGNGNQSRGLSISTAATGGQQDATVIFNAQDTENVAYPAMKFQTGGGDIFRFHHQSIINNARVGLTHPCELMFNGEYTAGQQDVALEAGHAARIEFLKDDFFRIQGSASVSAGASISYADKLKVNIDAGGILFGSDTAAANTLDDYEEGTWTPTINSGTMGSGATGTYTKVGRLVTVTYYILLTTMGGSTTPVQVGGLPFTSGISGNTGSHSAGSILCRYFTKNQIVSYVPAGVTYIAFYNNSSSNWDQITFGELEATHDNDFEAHGTLQYIV